jgi:hypothetical protein
MQAQIAGIALREIARTVESLEPSTILNQIDKVEKADRVARRTFGLDDREAHGQSIAVNIAICG